ncbi:hypothetical protein SGRA_3581 [Saprospira grandis str. Lewin]|uniref:Uncharacterized protein n=1 Tax=Saprospira grandis (strain Lewin) TaxID=984262 RepID=H6L5Q5_SAPGL|nr:hypothetical protein SGRA_3581 [Saprospira grandis str. Lewin]
MGFSPWAKAAQPPKKKARAEKCLFMEGFNPPLNTKMHSLIGGLLRKSKVIFRTKKIKNVNKCPFFYKKAILAP